MLAFIRKQFEVSALKTWHLKVLKVTMQNCNYGFGPIETISIKYNAFNGIITAGTCNCFQYQNNLLRLPQFVKKNVQKMSQLPQVFSINLSFSHCKLQTNNQK